MKILAIDIGTAQIKSVVIESRFSRFSIIHHDIVENKDSLKEQSEELAGNLSPGQLEALFSLWDKYHHSIDKVVTNIPNGLYSNRLNSFPFKDRKKINAAMRFAIEDEIPFDLDESVLCNQIFSGKGKETHVLSGVAPLNSLQSFVNTLEQKSGIDPDAILTTQGCLATFFQKNNYGAHPIAAINLGHRTSTIYIYLDGVPIMKRTCMTGGYHITKRIAEHYNIGIAEAEVAKIKNSFYILPQMKVSEDQREFSQVILDELEPAYHDFFQTLMAFSHRYEQNVSKIYVMGGTSLIPGTNEYLSQRWKTPVQHLNIIRSISNVMIKPTNNSEVTLPAALLLGLSQTEGNASNALNFRTGKLQSTKANLGLKLQAFALPAKLLAILYVISVISIGVQLVTNTKQMAKIEVKRTQALKKVFTKTSSSFLFSLKKNPAKLKREVNRRIKKLEEKKGVENIVVEKFSALDVIRSLSKKVRKSTTTEIKKLKLSKNKISLTLESPNEAPLNAAMRTMKSLSYLNNSQQSKPVKLKTGRLMSKFEASIKGIVK